MARPKNPTRTDEDIRRILLRAEALDGLTLAEQADRLEVDPKELSKWKAQAAELFTVPGPWQDTFQDRTWKDMPGGDDMVKRMNFSLFRRGRMVFNDEGRLVSASVKTKGQWESKSRGRPKRVKAKVDPDEVEDVEALREDDEGPSARERAVLAALLGDVGDSETDAPAVKVRRRRRAAAPTT